MKGYYDLVADTTDAKNYKSAFTRPAIIDNDYSYITTASPLKRTIVSEAEFPVFYTDKIRSGFYSLFIRGRCLYKNLANEKMYVYKFIVEMNFGNNSILYRYKENDNIEQSNVQK